MAVTWFTSDLLYMAFKAVSTTPLNAEPKVLSTADPIVAHISFCSFFITQFTARRILCYTIDIMIPSICILQSMHFLK
jgi:hypothetical protein